MIEHTPGGIAIDFECFKDCERLTCTGCPLFEEKTIVLRLPARQAERITGLPGALGTGRVAATLTIAALRGFVDRYAEGGA